MDDLIAKKRKGALFCARRIMDLMESRRLNLNNDSPHASILTSANDEIIQLSSTFCEYLESIIMFQKDDVAIMYEAILNTAKDIFAIILKQLNESAETEGLLEHHNHALDSWQSAFIQPEQIAIKLKDICGMDYAKEQLSMVLLYPLYKKHMSDIKHTLPKPQKSVLLYGPPGTGKTMLVKAAANAARLPILALTSADFISKWQGESEKEVKRLFQEIALIKRGIIFIDEADAIFSKRSGHAHVSIPETESGRRIKTEFLIFIQQFLDTAPAQTFLIAATNLIQDIDPAFLRRFESKIPVNIPTTNERESYLRFKAPDWNDADIISLAKQLTGFSYADMDNFTRAVFMKLLSESLTHERDTVRQPCKADFESILANFNV